MFATRYGDATGATMTAEQRRDVVQSHIDAGYAALKSGSVEGALKHYQEADSIRRTWTGQFMRASFGSYEPDLKFAVSSLFTDIMNARKAVTKADEAARKDAIKAAHHAAGGTPPPGAEPGPPALPQVDAPAVVLSPLPIPKATSSRALWVFGAFVLGAAVLSRGAR